MQKISEMEGNQRWIEREIERQEGVKKLATA
jgi:hypothetical protein